MSKAFTRESDGETEQPVLRPRPSLPPGVKNYLTPDGEQRLRRELVRLLQTERPRVAALTGDAEARRQLAALDQQIVQLQQCLGAAVVVPPPSAPRDTVRFGATVTVRNRLGKVETYRIVGVDELDLDRNWVSFLSPIAKALLNARLGQRVRFQFPSGEDELEVTGIDYPP